VDGWAGLGSVHRALETIRRVQWLVTPRAARTHRIRLADARGWRSGAWMAAKHRFTLFDFRVRSTGIRRAKSTYTGDRYIGVLKKKKNYRVTEYSA